MSRPPLRHAPILFALTLLAGTLAHLPARAQAGEERLPAMLLPAHNALFKAKHTDRVTEVAVRVGDRVRAGDVLLKIYSAEQRVGRDRAQAELEQARADLERAKALHERGGTSDEVLEDARTSVRLEEADLELARILLEERTIRAPFDGVVTERFVDAGTSVETGDLLLRVTGLSPLRIEALVPERLLGRFGGPLRVELIPSFPDTVLVLEIDARPIVVDAASGTFPLVIEIDNPTGRLIPGVSCDLLVSSSAP